QDERARVWNTLALGPGLAVRQQRRPVTSHIGLIDGRHALVHCNLHERPRPAAEGGDGSNLCRALPAIFDDALRPRRRTHQHHQEDDCDHAFGAASHFKPERTPQTSRKWRCKIAGTRRSETAATIGLAATRSPSPAWPISPCESL